MKNCINPYFLFSWNIKLNQKKNSMKYVRFDGEIIIDVYYEGTEYRTQKKTSNIVESEENCSLYRVEIFAIFLNVSQMN